jgi:hypothetical protein
LNAATLELEKQLTILTKALTSRMYVGSVQQVNTPSVQSTISRTTLENVTTSASMSGGSFQIKSIRDLLGSNFNGSSFSQKSTSYQSANIGSNPTGAVSIGGSRSIGICQK